jgi:hypothetical protein
MSCLGKTLKDTPTAISPISKDEKDNSVLVGISLYYQSPYGLVGHMTQSITRIEVVELNESGYQAMPKRPNDTQSIYGEEDENILEFSDRGAVYPFYFFIANKNKKYGIKSFAWMRSCGDKCYQNFSAHLKPENHVIFDPKINEKVYFSGIFEVKLDDYKSEGILSTKASYKPRLIEGSTELEKNKSKHEEFIKAAYGGDTISFKSLELNFLNKMLLNSDYYWKNEIQKKIDKLK